MTDRARGCRRFDGRTVLVTGAGAGIGRACAHRLAAEGARVALADLDGESVRQLADELDGRQSHLPLRLDVTDRASVDDGVATAMRQLGSLDALVHVAGGAVPFGGFEEADDDAWRQEIELNLLGSVRCCRAVIPHLRASRNGPAIVVVSSVNALTGIGLEAYSSAKAGLGSLTQNLAVQLGPAGIRVNAIAPGTVRTRVWDRQAGGADRMLPMYPLGRVGEPQDIAAAAAFLVSDDAAWVTGVMLPVDGGLLAGRPVPG